MQATVILIKSALAGCVALVGANAWAAQVTPEQTPDQKAEEIIVVGRRSGIPMWHVTSGQTTVVLVGTIDGVTKTTVWDPSPLIEAMRMSDRVMFPEMQQVTASPIAMIGYLAKWRRQASLPKGQTLRDFLSPAQFQRLQSLQQRGIASKGAEKKHPLYLAFDLRDTAKGNGGYALNASQYVRQAIRKYKLNLVPIQKSSAKSFAANLFSGSPSRHVPCLIDAMEMAEAGSAAVAARSQAWAQRKVPEVLNSPAEDVYHSCFPAESEDAPARRAALHGGIKRLLLEPKITVAILDLHTLARQGGVLDDLSAAGHQVRGPAWRR